MQLNSSDIENNKPIQDKFSRYHENKKPTFTWSSVPSEAVELVLLCYDPIKHPKTKKVIKTWLHWVVSNIDPLSKSLTDCKYTEGTNDFKEIGYGGPQPPPKQGVHEYHFKLYALKKKSGLTTSYVDFNQLDKLLNNKDNFVCSAEIIGTYVRN